MKVENVMTSPARSCAPTDNLHTAAEIMWQADCGCVPVTDENRRAVGIITDRDICIAAHLDGEPLRSSTVGAVMSNIVHTCHPDDSLREVATTMSENRLRRLPVVDADGRLVGIVSLNDLALAASEPPRKSGDDALTQEEVAATLAAICQHRPNSGSAEPH